MKESLFTQGIALVTFTNCAHLPLYNVQCTFYQVIKLTFLRPRDGSVEFSKPVPKYQLQGGSTGGAGDAVAPMPGVIEKVFLSNRVLEIQLNFKVMVEEGAAVAAGDPLMVMIAMKMEYVIKVTFTHLSFGAGLKNTDKTQHTIAQI